MDTLPELEEIKNQLTEEELVYAEDLTIKTGESLTRNPMILVSRKMMKSRGNVPESRRGIRQSL